MEPGEAAKIPDTDGAEVTDRRAVRGRRAARAGWGEALRQTGFYLCFAVNALICLRLLGSFDGVAAVVVAPPWQVATLCGLGLVLAGLSAWLMLGARVDKAFKQGAVAFGAVLPALFLGFFLWTYLDTL